MKDGAAVERPASVRPLLGAAQSAADRLASEIRALGDSLPEPVGRTMRESLRALHAALTQLDEVHGGSIRPSHSARVDPLKVMCEVAEAAHFDGVAVELDARGAFGELNVDESELRRMLRWLVDRASSNTTGTVRVEMRGEAGEVVLCLPWHDEFAESVSAQEQAWLERSVDALAGRLEFADGRVHVRLPRGGAAPAESSFGDLAREVNDLRRERLSHAQEVERATCALHSAQLEAEAARRQLSRIERSTLRAVADLQHTFESLEAMAGLVVESDGIGRDLQVVSQSGLARVMELVAEVDTAAMSSANSIAPTWSDAPNLSGIQAPRELLDLIEEEGFDSDPTPR